MMFDENTEYRDTHITHPDIWLVPNWAHYVVLSPDGWWEAHMYRPEAVHRSKYGMLWISRGPSDVIAKGQRIHNWDEQIYEVRNRKYIND